MKQTTVSLVVLALAFSFATTLSAQAVRVNVSGSATGTPVRVKTNAEVKAQVEARKASTSERNMERKEEMQARKASSTERRLELQASVVKRKASQTASVIRATIGRLENIITRLESRIAKVKANGGNVLESEKFVAEAKAHLNLAKESVAVFATVELSETRLQDNFIRIRDIAKEAKEHIRNAHQSLMKALRALKPGQANADVRATSTATTTVQ